MMLRVLDIVEGTMVDGPGLRTSIYLAGCGHRCEGCHNPQSWDAQGGHDMSLDNLIDVIAEAGLDVTLSGGDPLFQPAGVAELCRRIKQEMPDVTVWLYTGYTYEQVAASAELSGVLEWIDVMVDGRFVAQERNVGLLFRGSRNQRIIDVKASIAMGEVHVIADTVLAPEPF